MTHKDNGFYLDKSKSNIASLLSYPGGMEVMKDVFFKTTKKPCAWHRFWMRVFFGWKWIDGSVIGGMDEH